MPARDVREPLRDAYQEIEGCCEQGDLDNEDWLRGIARQLHHFVDGDTTDPEALAFPDPGALDTIAEHLAEAIDDADGDTRMRLRRARDNILLAVAKLEDSLEKQRSR